MLGVRLCLVLSVSSLAGDFPFLGPYNPLLTERLRLGDCQDPLAPASETLETTGESVSLSDFNQRCNLFRGMTGAQENDCSSVTERSTWVGTRHVKVPHRVLLPKELSIWFHK